MTSKAVTKKRTVEEMRERLKKSYSFSKDPDQMVREIDNKVSEYLKLREKKDVDEDALTQIEEEANDLMQKAIPLFTLDNNVIASLTVGEFYQSMTIEVANQLTKEYEANTASERALVGMIASAYARYMEYSRAFNRSQQLEFLSNEKNGYFRNFAVEADRAFRQFQSGLGMLRQMKSPAMKVTVKAETAFVAQNQQLNATQADTTNKKVYDTNASK